MKVNELEGDLLDYWVFKAEGRTVSQFHEQVENEFDRWRIARGNRWQEYDPDVPGADKQAEVIASECDWYYSPSTLWKQGGPIIERANITLLGKGFGGNLEWEAVMNAGLDYGDVSGTGAATGPTALIAAMRCYVSFMLGDEVEEVTDV